jgi:hypothetical protein
MFPTMFKLQESVGTPGDCVAAPARLLIDGSESGAPIDLREMIEQLHITFHAGVAPLLSPLPQRGTLEARPDHAAALPITDGPELVGCFIIYIGAGQRVDEPMKRFLDLLAWQVSVAVTAVKSYQLKERSKPHILRHDQTLIEEHVELEELAAIRAELEHQVAQQMRRLEESRESYTRLCELVPVGIHRSNPTGRVIW